MKKILITLIKAVFIGAVFFFIAKVFYDNQEAIKDYPWHLDTSYLVLSLILLTVAFLLNVIGWHLILLVLGSRLHFLETARIWSLSHLSRYVPGYVWQFATRVVFLNEKGVSKKRGMLSLHLEAASMVLSAVIVTLISILFSTNKLEGANLSIVIFAIAGCAILIHPKVLEVLLNTFFTILKKDKVKVSYSFNKMLLIVLHYVTVWVLFTAAFFFLIKSLYDVNISIIFNLAFSFTASWVMGFLTIFAPGGIGVREGFLIVFLRRTLPAFLTPVVSVITRLWTITGELISLAVFMILYKYMKVKEKS
jgi:uncharacterized membrane protein YbhN (UPF0104 family)